MKGKLDFKLYVITGENYHPGRSMLEVMEAALKGGADIVQLRDKDMAKRDLLEKAKRLKELTAKYNVPLIVNDHPDVALAVDADGVHLGQDDMPVAVARQIMGPDRIIGLSTHRIEQAREAEESGADYIGVGPVYATGTKPGRQPVTTAYVSQVAVEIRIPWVAIGGITLDNATEVLNAGASRLCAVSAVVGAEDPEAVCRRFKALIETRERLSDALVESEASGMFVTVNGRRSRTRASTLLELAEQYELQGRRVVAELDGEFVPRRSWGEAPLRSGATVEFVHFVGGG